MDEKRADARSTEIGYGTRDSLVRALQIEGIEPPATSSLDVLVIQRRSEVFAAALERVRTERGKSRGYDPEKRYQVLCMKYGLGEIGEVDARPRTRKEMEGILDLSDERVRQLERDAEVRFRRVYQEERKKFQDE